MYNNSFAQNIIFDSEGYDLIIYPQFCTLHFNNLKDAVDKGVELAKNGNEVAVHIYVGDYLWYSAVDGVDHAFEIAIVNAAMERMRVAKYHHNHFDYTFLWDEPILWDESYNE